MSRCTHASGGLSFTFDNEIQDQLIIDGLLWLGGGNPHKFQVALSAQHP
jgi:hypothetical protein